MPVRSDEQFDEKKLAIFLKDKIKGANNPLKIRQFGGGAANLTYLLQFGDSHEYVLRRPPLGPVAKSAHDMKREYTVLSSLYKKFPFAPRAFLYCSDFDIIGSDFFIMERKKGFVIRNSFPEYLVTNPEVARDISIDLIDKMVNLQKVDFKELGLEDLGKPDGFVERQVEGWYNRWQKAKSQNQKEMDDIYNWLKDRIPRTQESTLIHNDYKLDNVMLDYTYPHKIVSIFDWDMCTLGDPLNDLGALLAYWSEPSDPPYLQAISTMPTNKYFLTREELIDRYQEQRGINVDNINFYHVLGVFRLVVIIAQIYIRFLRKQTQDQRFAGLGEVIPLLAKRGFDLTI